MEAIGGEEEEEEVEKEEEAAQVRDIWVCVSETGLMTQLHLCCTSVAPLLHICCTSVAPCS